MAQLRHQEGEAAVDQVFARHRPAASRVPGVLDSAADLDEDEAIRGARLAASVESHLSHNLLVQRPLFDAWAEILVELLPLSDATLLVENLAEIDRESLAALRSLYRQFPDDAPALVAGYDPNERGGEPDADGLVWQNPAEDIHTVALGFAALPGSEVVDLPPIAPGSEPPVSETQSLEAPAGTLDSLDDTVNDAIDDRARAILDRTPPGEPLDAASSRLVIEAVEACFACFGFTAALRLGLDLVERSPELDAAQVAKLHGLVALCAHNRQFRSRGNRDLAAFLERHLLRAFEAEALPARRSCLAYRLAVTTGRRKKDFPAALAWSDRSVDEAIEATDLPRRERARLEAWGRNIRAYVLLGLGRPGDAKADCERTFEILDASIESPFVALRDPDPLVQEVGFTHSLLADNLAALAKFRDDGEDFAHWKAIADEITRVAPGVVRFEAILWIDLYRGLLRYDLAIEKAEQGLESSRREEDPLREYNYAVQLADLHDRRGDARAAVRVFEQAAEIYERLGHPAFLRPVDGYLATSLLRAGDAERARRLFADRLERLDEADRRGRAELCARLGLLEATEGHGEAAEDWIDRAIEHVVADGERVTLVSIATLAGRSARALGRVDEAQDAYRRALDLLGSPGDASTSNTSAGSAFAAQIGLAEEGDSPVERLVEAVRLWPTALSDSEAWWDLPRLGRALEEASESLAERLESPDLAESVARVRLALAQRIDKIEPRETTRTR